MSFPEIGLCHTQKLKFRKKIRMSFPGLPIRVDIVLATFFRKFTKCTVYLVSHGPSETEGALVMKGFNDNFMISGLDLLENP